MQVYILTLHRDFNLFLSQLSDCAAGVGFEGGGEYFHRAGEVFFIKDVGHADFVLAHAGGSVEA